MNFLRGNFGTDPSPNMATSNSSAASTSSASTIDFQSIAKSVDTAAGIAIGLFIAYSAYKNLSEAYRRGDPWRKFPLPPSPPGDFLLGHYRHVPEDESFRKYSEWSKKYNSDVLYFETLGTKWVVLNSYEAAHELLDVRGRKYSDRPRFVMFEEMGWAPTLTWLRWGPQWGLHRKVLAPPLTKTSVVYFQPLQKKQAMIMCKNLIENPEDWMSAVTHFAVSIMMKIAYGIDVDTPTDRWVKLAAEASEAVGKAGAPASSIMDRIPWTRHLPDWLPFMERLKYAHQNKKAIQDITERPFTKSMCDYYERYCDPIREIQECFVHKMTYQREKDARTNRQNDYHEEDIKGGAATMLIAGNDTTASTVNLIILYLVKHPRVQRRAQAEVDYILLTTGIPPEPVKDYRPTTPAPWAASSSNRAGTIRLPSWPDIPKFKYVNLVLQEVYRINPLSPLGIPHASVKDSNDIDPDGDDTYNGMRIPCGTIVYPNVWAMNRDEKRYREPERFFPERYLPKEEGGWGEPFPVGNFGFGRRICVGQHLAENSLLIAMAMMLATIEFDLPVGPDGNPKDFEPEFSHKGQSIVLPFEVSIKARSPVVNELLDRHILVAKMAEKAADGGKEASPTPGI
ncbi:cytochrome P450 [Copromyces sp. CBS 386.78]|nr:cytochrome P450 [Copromyces sp. CBS 386.78]